MKVAIIKYNSGNTQSVLFALERLNVQAIITDNTEEITSADKIIFPGVGEASTAMAYLKERKLDEAIIQLKQPVLGICLGMQLLCNSSEEGDTKCLGVFDTTVKRIVQMPKVPHMGWNKVDHQSCKLFKGIKDEEYFYFVHGYFAEECRDTSSTCEYGTRFSSSLSKGNFYGVQFHPEKSASAGEQLLENFLTM